MKASKEQKIYFKNLNALRFFAALIVILHHVGQIGGFYHLQTYDPSYFLQFPDGSLGVTLFFVLSGFLITYILLAEQRVTRTISIKDFYIRRILRIWPLYFLIVILSLFILPHFIFFDMPGISNDSNIFLKSILFIFFLPNLLLIVCGIVPYASQTWSIGTEEQFYLFWPWIFKSKRLNKFHSLFLVIILYNLTRLVLLFSPPFIYRSTIRDFLALFSIDCMAIGGIGALLFFYKMENILRFIYNKYLQIVVFIGTIILMVLRINFGSFHHLIYSILFCTLILNLSTNPNNIFKIENKITNFLGKISYGLYMYHSIAIVITIRVLLHYKLIHNYLIYLCSILISVILAALSYLYFEKIFLDYKIKFSKVISGDTVKQIAT